MSNANVERLSINKQIVFLLPIVKSFFDETPCRSNDLMSLLFLHERWTLYA
jgi:hypothetical protein